MTPKLILFFALFIPVISMAQPDTASKKNIEKENVIPGPGNADEEDPPLMFAQQLPKFPGGEEAMLQFISNNLVYPSLAIENDIQGKSIISFVVDRKGRVTDLTVVRKLGYGCDEAAMKVLMDMPAWTPGSNDGKLVKVKFVIPITFALRENSTTASVTQAPAYPGGKQAMDKFLSENLQYPKSAKKAKLKGTVIVAFMVNTDGTIATPRVMNSLSKDCDAESLRVLALMPKWEPATRDGKKVAGIQRLDFLFPQPGK